MGELGTYKPFDYPRRCDVCGNRRRISKMVKMPGGVWVCDIHKNERTAVELDRLNAKQKPYNIIPVPNAKPESQYPDVMEAEEAVLMNLVARMVAAGTRYESVTSGRSAIAGEMIAGLSWSARYLYSIITDTSTPSRVLTQAKALLLSIATQLMDRQRGFGISSGGRAADPWYGGFLESGASTYLTNDTATSGLAMLYAYRVFGTLSYIASARAAANYLRNVQAIGRYATIYFTSSNSAGTARLYTGAVASEVSTAAGVDPGEMFYSNHLFYPSGLVALEFWKALQTTDGDQTIGATGTASDAFTSAPSQLMSTSITDMRACWTTGITDATATLITGLSSTTPREYFNAFPASKAQFASITGTGRWEFADAGAATGTTITGLNFATALASLYAYEGATSQVTTIDDWLRSFTSNSDFESPDDVSAYELARTTTGEYDPTICLSTLLLVRDADASYAAIKVNGSSLYDWGAFGVLSPMWATRHTGTFPDARRSVFGNNQRFSDGTIGDGDYTDWKSLRGMSGLTYQTGFATTTAAEGVPFPVGGNPPVTDRDAQGTNVEWDASGVYLLAPATHNRYDIGSVDEASSALMQFNDGLGSVCPDGGIVYLRNISLDVVTAEHMNAAATSVAYPFFCVGETDLSIGIGVTVAFVRVSLISAWVQATLLASVNDVVRASMFGLALRQNPTAPVISS